MLYVVATPIGNLDDITLRALETLKQVDFIIAENPGHTKHLLDHYQINKKMLQFADHNELQVLDGMVEKLKTVDGALVTDAGTPGVSDPGFRLVRACVENQIQVTPIPGASGAVTALSASGLPTDKYLFVGFLPKTEPKLMKLINEAKSIEATLVAYESPERIIKTIERIAAIHPDANLVIARELTKIHEEFIRGNTALVLEQLQAKPSIKGEITLLVSFK